MDKKIKTIKKSDIVLIALLLLTSVFIYSVIRADSEKGTVAAIYVDGKCKKKLSLEKDFEYLVTVESGSNLVVIRNHCAYVKEADCKDKLCVHQKPIRKRGETIVCLPHKVVVQIEGGEDSEIDGISS